MSQSQSCRPLKNHATNIIKGVVLLSTMIAESYWSFREEKITEVSAMPCKGKRYRKTGDSYEKDIYIHLKSLLEYLLCYLGTELYLKKKDHQGYCQLPHIWFWAESLCNGLHKNLIRLYDTTRVLCLVYKWH